MSMRTTYLRFGQLRQERGEKHVRIGELVTATNVRQTDKAGVYQKRKGFDPTVMTFSGSTLGSAEVSSCVPAKDLSGSLMRDTNNKLWSRDTSANVWNYRGEHPRSFVDTKIVNSSLYGSPRLVNISVGDNIWAFAITTKVSGAGSYDLTIYNKASGQVVSTTSDISAAIGSNPISAMAACYNGTDVWLFWVTGANTAVKSHKFTGAVATSTPTAATYYTAGGSMSAIACCHLATTNKTLVAFCGNSGGTARLYHSQLDTTNGQSAASPAAVQVLNDVTALPVQALGFHADQDATDGASKVFYHYDGFQIGGSGATYSGPVTVTVTMGTLAATVYNHTPSSYSAATDAITAAGIANVPIGGGVTGEVVIWSKHTMEARMTCSTNGGSGGGTLPDSTDYAPSSWWLASGILYSNPYIYFLTAHDDIAWSAVPLRTGATIAAAQTVSQQRSFHVRRMLCTDITANVPKANPTSWTWRIVGHFLNGSAPARFHGASSTVATAGSFPSVGAPPAAFYYDSRIITTAAADIGSTGNVGLVKVDADFDPNRVWGKECGRSGRAYSPGSIPICWSKDDYSHEISPLLAPSWIYMQAAGTGSDFATAAAVYVIRDKDGTLYRSAPTILSTTIGHGATLYIPTLHHFLQDTTVFIEIYLGTDAKPKLQTTVANNWNTAYNYISYTTPTAATMANGEVLYALGNALTQAWPPQCQAVGSWRQRLFLASKNIIWTSLEESIQQGPLFNEVMRSTFGECQTDINAMGAVDANYFALLGSNAIGVIDGPGPDQLGSGNYSVKPLNTQAGVAAGAPVCTSEAGAYFQDTNTRRLMCVTQGLQTLECAGGAYDTTALLKTIIHYEKERLILFSMSLDSSTVVVDYQHKTDAAPFGQVYLWTLATRPFATSMDTTGVFYLGSTGWLYRPSATCRDNNVDYRMVLKTAQIQLADLQGEFDISRVQVLGKLLEDCSVKITTFPDYATAGTATTPKAHTWLSGPPLQLVTRPPNCMRIQSIAIQVEDTASTGSLGSAFNFEGFAIEWMPRGKIKHLNTSQVVS